MKSTKFFIDSNTLIFKEYFAESHLIKKVTFVDSFSSKLRLG